MATELKMTLLLRRAAFADSCILQLGEPGYHTGTKEFKVGDGSTTWANLPVANETQIKGWISALESALTDKITENTNKFANYYTKTEIDGLLSALRSALEGLITAEATARAEADTQIRTDFAAADAATLAEAKGYADTKKAEVIGTSADAKTADTVYGAKAFATDAAATAKSEAISAAAADATSKANAAEAAAKTHAETKASAAETAAKGYADTQDTALHTTITGEISAAKTELEGKISSGDATTLQSAKDYTDEKVAAEALARSNADTALDNKITALRNEIGNLTNVMNFRGAVDAEADITDPVEGDVITIKGTGVEKVYSGGEWIEIGTASASDAAIAALQERMTAAEEDIGENASAITTLGTNKLDAQTFNNWKATHEADHANKQTAITSEINTAKQGAYNDAVAEAARLDGVLKTELQAEIDSDVEAAIAAEVTRSNAKAKELADAAEAAAKSYADSQDAALKTAIEGAGTDASSKATIAGAKKYAEEKAAAAQSAAEATAAADATSKANAAQAAAEATAAADATAKANAAESNAKAHANTEVGKEKTRAEAQEAAIRGEFAAADTATLTAAKAYADEKVTDAHKNYQTATVKDAAHDSATNPSFITSISIDKGHVTGATVRNLAEVLAAMEFIFDGGTSAN